MMQQAIKTRKKREDIIKHNSLYPCKKCQIEKPADEFVIQYIDNQLVGKYRYLYECRQCKKERTYKKRNEKRKTIEWACKIMLAHIYQWAKKRNISFSITEWDLLNLRRSQQWKCYYSWHSMTFEFVWHTKGTRTEKTKYQASCDRKDNELWYTWDNIVLCCTFINKMKWNLSEKDFYDTCSAIVTTKKLTQ